MEHFETAIDRLESVRASLRIDEFKSAYMGDKLSVYYDLIDLLLEQQHLPKVFEYVERAKSRVLLDMLSKGVEARPPSTDPATAKLSEDLEKAREDLNWFYLSAENEGMDGPSWEKVRETERKVAQYIHELERLQPQAATLETVAVTKLDDVLERLDEDTVLIEYFGDNDTLSALILDHQGICAVRDLASPQDIKHHMNRLSFFMGRVAQSQNYAAVYSEEILSQQVNRHLKALYDALIEPLNLDGKAKNLLIIPHGSLHAVPFAGLFNGDSYLIDQYRISYAPSAAIYLFCQQRSQHEGERLTVFGVPVEDIPAVLTEVQEVSAMSNDAETFIGKDASLAAFFKHAPDANVLHIATHGVYRPDNPMFSGLRLGDGWLAARDLYGLNLKASLVVLSACETGLGSYEGGDEVFGIARGFLYAGAPALVASHWAVKDTQTAQLMIAFYQTLQNGVNVAEALRDAQLTIRKNHPNPYYWASFALVGDPERKVASGLESGQAS